MANPRKFVTADATVVKICNGGTKRAYAVCSITFMARPGDDLNEQHSVTFSLPEFEGEHRLRVGQQVCLSEFELFSKGWRARKATPITPSSQSTEEE